MWLFSCPDLLYLIIFVPWFTLIWLFSCSDLLYLILLQREVRRHFSCPSLEGGELEDQGVNGTASTHWEKRVYEVNFALLYKYSLPLSLFKDALSFPINVKKIFKKWANKYYNKCFLWTNLCWVRKKNNTAFLTSKLPTSTTPSFMTDLLIIILENFGIWLLGYKIELRCLFIS